MGYPYEPDYKKHESRYLACEIEVVNEILTDLEGQEGNHDANIVVDTTGSVIYAVEEILFSFSRPKRQRNVDPELVKSRSYYYAQ